jgi:hypothetical protein
MSWVLIYDLAAAPRIWRPAQLYVGDLDLKIVT